MTQHQFDFDPKPCEKRKEILKWVEQHNQKVIFAARNPTYSPGSLLTALDASEVRGNAVYLLRGVLGQYLRKSMSSGMTPFKRGFSQALQAEVSIKKTVHDPACTLRNILIKTLPSR